jgi:hypothetical protein
MEQKMAGKKDIWLVPDLAAEMVRLTVEKKGQRMAGKMVKRMAVG